MQNDWLKYSCQVALPGFTESSQQKLADAKILIVGMGGLGCPAAQYLAAMGIGMIGLVDGDTVSVSNLHRQILYTPADEGKKKVLIAKERLGQLNPDVNIIPHELFVSNENVMHLISEYDIILDCTDNFETRYLLNDACVLSGKPLAYGAIYQYEGQVAVWNVQDEQGNRSPNYRDLFPDVNAAAIPNCADGGVMPTIAGIIGCMQANEAVKYIIGSEDLLAGKLLIFDARSMQSRVMKLRKITHTNITALPEVIQIEAIEFSTLQSDKDAYELVDVRTKEEREEYNIGGKHIPLQELSPASLSTDTKPVVFYCASGKRSSMAVKQLAGKINTRKLYSLKGGVKELSR